MSFQPKEICYTYAPSNALIEAGGGIWVSYDNYEELRRKLMSDWEVRWKLVKQV